MRILSAIIAGFATCLLGSSLFGLAVLGSPHSVLHYRIASAHPAPSSLPGIVVCDPIYIGKATPSVGGLTAFGSGCARWLHLTVAGLPELGQSASWDALLRVQTELGRSNLQFEWPNAGKLAAITGADVIATGSIRGNPTKCTLTFQLWKNSTHAPLGGALNVSGSETQVVAALPGVARQMALQLRVSHPEIPAVGVSPSELAFLGGLSRETPLYLPGPQEQELEALVPKAPLAVLFFVSSWSRTPEGARQAVSRLLKSQMPGNSLAWAHIGYTNPQFLADSAASLVHLSQRFPKNGLLAYTRLRMQQSSTHVSDAYGGPDQVKAAWEWVHDRPSDPEAWLTAAQEISAQAETLRYGRIASALSTSEWKILNGYYAVMFKSARQSCKLDPLNGPAWRELAVAGTFAGESSIAAGAFWEAYHKDADRAAVYWWGMEMFQSKWGGDPAALAKVARLAGTDNYSHNEPPQVISLAEKLRVNGFPQQSQEILNRVAGRVHAALVVSQNEPPDSNTSRNLAYLHGLLASIFMKEGNDEEAVTEYQHSLKLDPQDTTVQFEFARDLIKLNRRPEALIQYSQLIAQGPSDAGYHYFYGLALMDDSQYAEAEKQMLEALRLLPSYGTVHYGLGSIAYRQQKWEQAASEFIQVPPGDGCEFYSLQFLAHCLLWLGRYSEAITAAKKAISLNPNDIWTYNELSDLYLRVSNIDASLTAAQQALAINPKDGWGHVHLGEIYLKQSKKTEAQAEWQLALTLSDSEASAQARSFLAQNP